MARPANAAALAGFPVPPKRLTGEVRLPRRLEPPAWGGGLVPGQPRRSSGHTPERPPGALEAARP